MTSHSIDPPDELDLFGAIHRKAAQQAAVAELGRRALTGAQREELLEEAVTSAQEALGTERVAVLQPDATGALVCVANVGWKPEEIHPHMPSDASQVGYTYLHGEPLVVVDYTRDGRFAASRSLADIGITSGISVPLRGDAAPVGVLVAHAREARTFTDDDVLFLRGVANVLAAALARARAEEARRRSEERLALLAHASDVLAGSLDERQTLTALVGIVVPTAGERCVTYAVHGDTLGAVAATPPTNLPPGAVPWPEGLPREELAAGTPVVVEPSAAPRALAAAQAATIVCVPLLAEQTLRALAFVDRADAQLDAGDLELYAELGRRASLALENAVAHEAERHARDRAESLQRVTAALAVTLTPDEVVDTVLEEVIDATGAALGLVAIVDEGGDTITVSAHRGFVESTMETWRTFPVDGPYPASEAVRTGEAVYCETLAERDARYPAFVNEQAHAHAIVTLPLIASTTLGAIHLSYPDERAFGPDDRAFLETIARQCAQALERTRLRSDLARERTLFETVLRQMPSAVVVGELPDLRIVLGNDQVERLWRRPLEDVKAGNRYETFKAFHLDGTPFAPEDWPLPRLAATGEAIEGELFAIERADGTPGFVRASATPLIDESGTSAYGVIVLNDVTEETQARQEAEARAHASRALEFVGDGVCLVDGDGCVRLWNRAARRITGVDETEIAGSTIESVLPAWGRIAGRIPVAEAGAERPARALTLPLEVGDRELWLSLSGVSFPDGVVYAFRDVTEEHQLERMKSDFIATVSHELRTPLAAIYGAATTLRQRAGLEVEQREAFLGMIEEQAERLTQIVTDILTASRVEAGELGVELARVDPSAIVDQVVELAERTAPGGRVTATIDPETPAVLADPDRLRQVLGNIVENALKYSPEDAPVELRVEPRGKCVAFMVTDRGPGIPGGEEERIFQKFVRLDANMRSGVSGTGLGLYICRELLTRMDGSIAVESSAGGSTFTVELPSGQ